MDTIEYRMHAGARTAFYISGALLIFAVVTAPVGLWFIWRAKSAKILFSATRIQVRAMSTTHIELADVTRLGLCKVPIYARGLGGFLARQKVGGDTGINLCLLTHSGKTQKILASMFEDHETLLTQVRQCLDMPYEEVTMGAFSAKWPPAHAG